MDSNCYVVGSGIVGSIVARELAEKGNKVTVLEKREHTGGNLYDFTDEYGIHVHMYGPHTFHTSSEIVWGYVTKYCDFTEYILICGSDIDGKCVPTSFDFETVDTFFPTEAATIKAHIRDVFKDQRTATVLEMLESNDDYIHRFAQFLYDKDYAPYTAKQWGISPDEVDKDIFKRVPIILGYGSRYFDDKYQAIPTIGYTELIDNLLNHENITVKTRVDALNHFSVNNKRILYDGNVFEGILVYTGPVDELFGCKYGSLPYRSLRFEWKHEDIESFQELPIVAYPLADGYTRITEYKKLPYQEVQGTTYAVEYPLPYKEGEKMEPYYPVLTDQSKQLYEKYKNDANKVPNLVCCGRLADFKYYNMDQAVERALEVCLTF